MKIRNGFVSNSSSSSFCIYGNYFDMEELIEKVKENKFLTEEEFAEIEENEENDDWYELVKIIEEKTKMEMYLCDDQVWIGRSWSTIGDDETGRQFKENVVSEMEKTFGTGSGNNCCTYEEEISN